jgi:hypothetical protein
MHVYTLNLHIKEGILTYTHIYVYVQPAMTIYLGAPVQILEIGLPCIKQPDWENLQ